MPPVWFAWLATQSQGSVNCLKSAANAEAEHALFLALAKEEGKTIDNLVFPSVGIISINKTKRHVENRYLETNLGAHTAADVGELGEQALIKAHHGICLRVPAHKHREESERQTDTIDR